jgi:hypothetical protein
MACELLSGYELDCRETYGSVKEIFIQQWEEFLTGVVYDSTTGLVEDLPTATLMRFVCKKNTASLVATANPNENGSVTYTTTVTFNRDAITNVFRREFELIAKNRLVVFVRDANDKIHMCGREYGLMLSGGDLNTGAALSDFNGFNIVLSGEETSLPRELEPYTTNPFDNAAFAITISPAY